MKKYLDGTILETLERVKSLKSKIPSNNLPDCFHQLAALCSNDIDHTINYLNDLLDNPKYEVELNQSRKLINFKKLVEYIDYLENKIIAPLNRWGCWDFIKGLRAVPLLSFIVATHFSFHFMPFGEGLKVRDPCNPRQKIGRQGVAGNSDIQKRGRLSKCLS